MNCKDCCQDCQRIGCDIEVNCTGYVKKKDYCKTCVFYPPSSCDGKPCTQCDPESPFQNCYVKKEADSKPTNADRIRSMTVEELAKWISEEYYVPHCPTGDGCPDDLGDHDGCDVCWMKWLKQEAK